MFLTVKRIKKILITVAFSVMVWACSSGGQVTEYSISSDTVTVASEDALENKQKDSHQDKPKPKGWMHTLDDGVLKVFKKEDSTVIYQRLYDGDVAQHSSGSSYTTLYHVYIDLESHDDIMVVCEEGQQGALLDFTIPDSVYVRKESHTQVNSLSKLKLKVSAFSSSGI